MKILSRHRLTLTEWRNLPPYEQDLLYRFQVRRERDLEHLRASLREQGVMTPDVLLLTMLLEG